MTLIAVARIASTYHVFNQFFDEPSHIAAGMEWLERGTYTYEPKHPPLARVATAAGPFLAGVRLSEAQNRLLDVDTTRQRRSHGENTGRGLIWGGAVWKAGNEILDGELYFRNLSLARAGVLPFFALCMVMVGVWSYRLFGSLTALAVIAFFSTLPPVLAHAGIASTDMAFTALFMSAIFAFVLWLEAPSVLRSAILGVTWALAALAKFSAFLFLPACAVPLLGLRWVMVHSGRTDSGEGHNVVAGFRLTRLLLAAAIGFIVLWAGYRFSMSPLTDWEQRFQQPVDETVGVEGSLQEIFHTIAEGPIPMPELVTGLLAARAHVRAGNRAYFLGEIGQHGWWYYFPVVLAIKTPLAFLVLVGVGCAALLHRSRRDRLWQPIAPLVCALAILLVSLFMSINIGIRHVLPIYPFLAMIAGFAFVYLWSMARAVSPSRVAAVGLLGWHLAASGLSHPDYLAYFNELARAHPERFVVDSNLDWGQDLWRLSQELQDREVPKLSLAYFGSADPEVFDLPPIRTLLPGQRTTGWVAISITALKGVYQQDPPYDGFRWLEAYEPVALVGKSMRLYCISDSK